MLTAEQVAIRATGIGASEVSAVLRLNPYAAPIDVWLEKTGRAVHANDVDPEGAITVGDELEAALVEMLGRRTGLTYARPLATFRHPTARHVLASPDALARGRRGGEIKVVGDRMRHHWGEPPYEVPDYVRTQCAQNMAVLGGEVWHVGALISGSTFKVYTVERDRELEDLLVESVEDFWSEHVAANTPPPVENPEERRRYLLARYPGSETQRVKLCNDPLVAAASARLREIDAEADALEAESKALQNDLCEIIGEERGIEGRWGKALWFPMSGKPDYKAIAEHLAGGVVPSAMIEAHRGQSTRVFRLYDPPKTTKGRRRR